MLGELWWTGSWILETRNKYWKVGRKVFSPQHRLFHGSLSLGLYNPMSAEGIFRMSSQQFADKLHHEMFDIMDLVCEVLDGLS